VGAAPALGVWVHLGLVGIWLGAGADFGVRALAAWRRFASGRWERLRV